jgi:hypothetical protein
MINIELYKWRHLCFKNSTHSIFDFLQTLFQLYLRISVNEHWETKYNGFLRLFPADLLENEHQASPSCKPKTWWISAKSCTNICRFPLSFSPQSSSTSMRISDNAGDVHQSVEYQGEGELEAHLRPPWPADQVSWSCWRCPSTSWPPRWRCSTGYKHVHHAKWTTPSLTWWLMNLVEYMSVSEWLKKKVDL